MPRDPLPQPLRLDQGGRIDRARSLSFQFDGKFYRGYAGDTLASALLANGVRLVGRSFKLHRPRGLLGSGPEEPNALVTVGTGARATPNLKATEVELADGLVAESQNRWPSLEGDLGGVAGRLSAFLPAGFYYKTFLQPGWDLFAPAMRRAAGLGRAPALPDPDRYAARHLACDVLVVGAGPAGLAAATAASEAGVEAVLVESRPFTSGEAPAGVRVMTRTVAFGAYDHGLIGLVERVIEPMEVRGLDIPRERLWLVRAKQVVLASGAIQQPVVFPGNDRPGVMLASAVVDYAQDYGVRAGRRIVVLATDDVGHGQAAAMHDLGLKVMAVVDPRPAPDGDTPAPLAERGIRFMPEHGITGLSGDPALYGVTASPDGGWPPRRFDCDLLAMAGPMAPTLHLFAQAGGAVVHDAASGVFLPGEGPAGWHPAGAARGLTDIEDCIADGARAGKAAAKAVKPRGGKPATPVAVAPPARPPFQGRLPGVGPDGDKESWVDFQNDVTVADVELAAREGYRSVEHLKRYTTLGMAVDQGKTSNLNGVSLLARVTGRTVAETGIPRFRPPFTPVSLGTLAGGMRGELAWPRRRLPADAAHRELGALVEEVGGWDRVLAYPKRGEDLAAALRREALAVRSAAGLFDASSAGKIEVVGPDAAEFLDRICALPVSGPAPGEACAAPMLTENATLLDDGICVRMAPDRFLLTTGTAQAARVALWLEQWLQTAWTDLKVVTQDVTAAWATITVSGPQARAVLAALGTDIELEPAAFPHLHWREGMVAGVPARVARVSRTGDLSYEISIAACHGQALWTRMLAVGAPHGLVPVGLEAWRALAVEKGVVDIGTDTDGTTTPDDLGWGEAVRHRPATVIGRRSLDRPANTAPDREQLVGFVAVEAGVEVPLCAHIVARDGRSEGLVTGVSFGPAAGHSVGLGRLRGGRARLGEIVQALAEDPLKDGRTVPLRVVAPCHVDPEGSRLHV